MQVGRPRQPTPNSVYEEEARSVDGVRQLPQKPNDEISDAVACTLRANRARLHGRANGRDPNLVSIFDLLPAIYAAVPDTNTEEIAEALRWSGKSFRDFTSSWRMITAPSRREHDETP